MRPIVYRDRQFDVDVWVEPFPDERYKNPLEIVDGDVEIDFLDDGTMASLTRYHAVKLRIVGDLVDVTYDTVYFYGGYEGSSWRVRGKWGKKTRICVNGRAAYLIREQEDLF